jgi:hypothetical protein
MELYRTAITNARGETFHVGDVVRAATFAGLRTGIIVTIWAFGATPIAVRIGGIVSDFAADDLTEAA